MRLWNRIGRRRLLAAMIVLLVVVAGARLLEAYTITTCDAAGGQWFVDIYDDSGTLTGSFHGSFPTKFCPF